MNQFLRRLVVLEPGEAPALLASFATLFCTFASYTMLRPVRDALGITGGPGQDPLPVLGRVRVDAAAAAAVRLAHLALPALGVPAVDVRVLRRKPAHVLGLVPPGGRPHLDRAHLLRVGERIQPVRRGGLLEPDGGCVHPRAGRTTVRLHLGGREHRRPGRPLGRALSCRAAGRRQPAVAVRGPVAAVAGLHGPGHPLAAPARGGAGAGGAAQQRLRVRRAVSAAGSLLPSHRWRVRRILRGLRCSCCS